MVQIGRRVFYDSSTGSVIMDTGEKQGSVVITTIEQDIASYTVLNERVRETFDVIELAYGDYAQDFTESTGYRVNPTSKTLEFSYPDPNAPTEPQPNQSPLSEVVTAHTDYLVDVDFRLSMVELGLV